MDFGLACEGITDQITIENILCGYFGEIDDLDEVISYIQPAFDETDNKQSDFGGWGLLLEYLKMKRFRDDVLNNQYIIIQVDTDISQEKGFDVSHYDINNKELAIVELLRNVKDKLIDRINQGDTNFYQTHQHSILFCITVHSLECWLFAFHNPQKLKSAKIKNCENSLRRLLSQGKVKANRTLIKNYDCYDALSRPFLRMKNINKTVLLDPSFQVFIQNLSTIYD